MEKYEILYIIDEATDDETKAQTIDKFKALVESLEGTVEKVESWDKVKFAYLINDKTEGTYVLMNYAAPTTVNFELERQMRNTDCILRSMVTKK